MAEDPVALAWYDDKTGQGEIGPEKPWQQKRSQNFDILKVLILKTFINSF